MDLGSLRPPQGAVKKEKRVGRGVGSGHGKTAGRGHKGQKARSGGRRKAKMWSEGGQMPLQRRLPKRGFGRAVAEPPQIVNVADLIRKGLSGEISPETMKEAGLIKRSDRPVKVLGDGEVDRALMIRAHAFSRSAMEKVARAGGKTEVI